MVTFEWLTSFVEGSGAECWHGVTISCPIDTQPKKLFAGIFSCSHLVVCPPNMVAVTAALEAIALYIGHRVGNWRVSTDFILVHATREIGVQSCTMMHTGLRIRFGARLGHRLQHHYMQWPGWLGPLPSVGQKNEYQTSGLSNNNKLWWWWSASGGQEWMSPLSGCR